MVNLEAMKQYRAAGLCPIPVKGKRPAIDWAEFQKRMPTEGDFGSWSRVDADGVGMVAGQVSGGLVCLDLDTKNDPTNSMVKEFFDLVKEMGGAGIIDACVGQKTPSGGYHLIFRCPEVHDGNQVFAKSDVTGRAVIETRGLGGQFVVHPSPGYTWIRERTITDVKTLPLADAELLFSAARAVDRAPLSSHSEAKPPSILKASGEITPIDDYDAKATVEDMQAEIEAAGFVQLRRRGDNIHYRRPGKSGRDTSATLHAGLKRFYVFTTSTDFEANRAYSPAGLLCYLHHGKDWSATAGALRRAGFGSPRLRPSSPMPSVSTVDAKPAVTVPGVTLGACQGCGPIIISPADLRRKVIDLHQRPWEEGLSTGWVELDAHLRIKRRRLNLVTGIPGSGKSSVLNHLFMNLAFEGKWKIAIFSPESESPADHAANLCEIRCGKPFFGKGRMSAAEAAKAAEEIAERFTFLDQDFSGVTFDELLKAASETKPDALLLDPWNRITHPRAEGMTETEYIGACLAKGAHFAKANNLSLWIVAHPQKVRRDKDGNQMRPGLYDISGSANWANMADNAMLIWRDYAKGATEIEVIKVRGKRDGEPGIVRMKFEKEIGRFRPWSDADDFALPPGQGSGTSIDHHAEVSSLPHGDRD